MSGSGIGFSSVPGILPDGEYGYFDSYPAGTTTCSTVQSESKPSSSAMRPSADAPVGVAAKPVLANTSPNFMKTSRRRSERRQPAAPYALQRTLRQAEASRG